MDKITGLQLRQTNNDTYAVPIGVWAQNVLWDESSILPDIIGDLDNLTTVNKGTLVAAINEAATTGSGGGSGSGTTITVDTALSSTSTNPVQNKVINTALNSKAGTAVATTSANGLMSSTDKSTLNGHETRITALENGSSGGGSGGGSSTLAGLTDTDISNKSDGQVLTYDSSKSKWVNKVPTGGGSSEWGTKKVLFFGDSIGAGYNNNNYSFVDVLQGNGFFGSVHKNCVAGTTTSTLHARLIESESQIADADIIYCEYQYNDVVGLIGGTLTTNALLSALNTAYNYIRQRNATCQIVWMPLTISHFDKVGLTNASYFIEWAEAMYPAFAERGISLLPVYDDIVAGHVVSDGKHPNTAGHKLIADHIMQAPLGISNYTTIILESSGGGSVTVDSSLSSTSTNPVQNKVIKQELDNKAGTAAATTSANGLMSSTDKQHLDAVYADYSAAITALGA